MMKRILIFFIVFLLSMYLSTKILEPNTYDTLFIKLLISGLLASVVFWLFSVWEEQRNTRD